MAPRRSFKDRFLDMVIEREDPVTPAAPQPRPGSTTSTTPMVVTPSNPSVNQEMLTALMDEVLRQSGSDYTAFHQIYDSLDGVPDEATRYRAAFKSASKMAGLTRERLLTALRRRPAILATEIQEIEATLGQKEQAEVGSKQSEIQMIDSQLAEDQRRITEIQRDMTSRQTRRTQLMAEKSAGEASLAASKARVGATATAAKAKIADELRKVEAYITT
ncbi:MAG: hypothetical protein ABIB97_05760 [Patescibacteria group bacterium]